MNLLEEGGRLVPTIDSGVFESVVAEGMAPRCPTLPSTGSQSGARYGAPPTCSPEQGASTDARELVDDIQRSRGHEFVKRSGEPALRMVQEEVKRR